MGATCNRLLASFGVVLVGLTLSAALRSLEAAVLRPGRITEMRVSASAGTVATQFPAPGAEVTPGTPVDLVVARTESGVPWIVVSALFAILGVAGATSMARSRSQHAHEATSTTISLEPCADPGAQSVTAGGNRVIESELCFEGRLDAGVQTLKLGNLDRLVNVCVEKRGTS